MLGDDPCAKLAWPSLTEKHSVGILPSFSGAQCQSRMGSTTSQKWKDDEKIPSDSQIIQRNEAYSGLNSQQLIQSELSVARKKQVYAQVSHLIKIGYSS